MDFSPLPRGPHGLSRKAVRSSQRSRILQAMTEAVAADGYSGAKIRTVAKLAGVSLASFYDQFSDKEECFLAAYDEVAEQILAVLGETVERAADWTAALDDGLHAYFSWFERHPAAAATFLVEVRSAGPRALARRTQIIRRFARFIEGIASAAHRAEPQIPAPRRALVDALVAAVDAMANEAVRAGRCARLRTLHPAAMEVASVLLTAPAPAAS